MKRYRPLVLFGLAPVDEETIQFMSTYATAPFILEYWLVFLGFLGVALVDIVRLDFAHSARAENPAVKLGLRTVALGGVVGLGYVANEGLYVLGAQVDATYLLGDKDMVTTVLVAGGTSLMIIGSTMPAWGPVVGISAAARWIDRAPAGVIHASRACPSRQKEFFAWPRLRLRWSRSFARRPAPA